MLRRINRPAKSLTCLCTRSYTASTKSIYPYNKLRAFPFVMTPERAQRLMAPHAQLLCGGPYSLRSMILDIFPESWNVKFKRPVSFAAVYFPAWLVSGSLITKIIFHSAKEITGFYFSKVTYIPGSDLPTMSTASFWPHGLNNVEPLPLTEHLLTQHDLRVNCVPFNTSPFSVLNLISSLGERAITIARGVKVLPKTLLNDFSAMPVLLPIYVATYADETSDSGDVLTLFIQAHSNNGNIKANQDHIVNFLQKKDSKEPIEAILIVKGQEVCNIGHSTARSAGIIRQIVGRDAQDYGIEGRDVDAYLSRMLGSSENIRKLALMGSLETDNDPRIREMTAEGIKQRNDWLISRDKMVDDLVAGFSKKPAEEATGPEKAGSKTDIWAKYAKSPSGSSAPASLPDKGTIVKKKKPGKGK